jgi:hypothetical protein
MERSGACSDEVAEGTEGKGGRGGTRAFEANRKEEPQCEQRQTLALVK